MLGAHADEYPVVADYPCVTDNKPVDFAIDISTDNCHRLRIQGQYVAYIFLFHFIKSLLCCCL